MLVKERTSIYININALNYKLDKEHEGISEPEAETAVLYRGTDRLRIEGVWCVPVEDFLRRMMPDRGLLAGL